MKDHSLILYTESIKSWMRLAWHVACMGEMGNAHKNLVCKAKGNRPFGRPVHKWQDDIINIVHLTGTFCRRNCK